MIMLLKQAENQPAETPADAYQFAQPPQTSANEWVFLKGFESSRNKKQAEEMRQFAYDMDTKYTAPMHIIFETSVPGPRGVRN